MVKKIAVYGTFVTYEPVWQRYWHKRSDGVRQRYWHKTRRLKKVVGKGRYEFHGGGRDLYRAVVEAHRTMPEGYVDVSAEEFLEDPLKYGSKGYWVEREVAS